MSDEQGAGSAPAPQPDVKRERAADIQSVVRLIAQRRLDQRRGIMVWGWNGAALCFSVAALGHALTADPGAWYSCFWAALSAMTARALNRMARDLDHARAALAFHELDRGVIGALMEALEWPNGRVRAIARLRLAELLPMLTGADAELLSPEQRTCLYDNLRVRDAFIHTEFVLAVLQVLPAIGDESVLPNVERLATIRGLTRNLRMVRGAARACLPRLERGVLARRTGASAMLPGTARAAPVVVEPRAPVPPHVEEVLQRVEQELGDPPQLRLPFLIAAWGIVVPASALLACTLVAEGHWYGALPVALVGVWASQLGHLTLTGRHRRIARELAELDDVNAVGRLAEAVAWPEPTLRAGAISALTRLLPRMRASDGAILSPYQRSCLYGALTREMALSHPEFLVALLKALEQVGDLAAVGPVEQLANARCRSARQRHVRDAAKDCLPYLLMVAEKNQQSQMLLRASCSPGAEAEVLLRPASGVGSFDPEWLLRPASEPAAVEVSAAEE